MSNNQVLIYPGFNCWRYSFYIRGLQHVFPKFKMNFKPDLFPKFHHHALPLVIGKNPGLKIYISAGDGPGYNQQGLEWCDVYAKRTLLKEEVPKEYAEKIIPSGPHHGLRVWSLPVAVFHALRAYNSCPDCIDNFRTHLLGYIRQYTYRLPESAFVPGQSESDYVFYASTLYPTHPQYNKYRATFIQACQKTPGLEFEGGLLRADDFRVPEYRDITISEYYRPRTWMEKIKKSALGFWAPGDQGAMTLKLAEFMAYGKAIIAVPIRQEMLPAPLRHGEQVHFVDGSLEDMQAAVRYITQDHAYRQKLERNARAYYDEWVAPKQAIQRFIQYGIDHTHFEIS